MFTKQYVKAQTALATKSDSVAKKLREEEGEIASQIIVMAFLVAVAVALKAAEGPLTELATGIVEAVSG